MFSLTKARYIYISYFIEISRILYVIFIGNLPISIKNFKILLKKRVKELVYLLSYYMQIKIPLAYKNH